MGAEYFYQEIFGIQRKCRCIFKAVDSKKLKLIINLSELTGTIMDKKKCLVFEAYPMFSGSQRITLNVCKILRKKGFSVTLLSVDDRFGNIKKHFEDHVDEIKHIKSHPVLLKYGDEDSWFKGSNFLKSVFLGLIPFYFRSLKLISSSKYDYLYC